MDNIKIYPPIIHILPDNRWTHIGRITRLENPVIIDVVVNHKDIKIHSEVTVNDLEINTQSSLMDVD